MSSAKKVGLRGLHESSNEVASASHKQNRSAFKQFEHGARKTETNIFGDYLPVKEPHSGLIKGECSFKRGEKNSLIALSVPQPSESNPSEINSLKSNHSSEEDEGNFSPDVAVRLNRMRSIYKQDVGHHKLLRNRIMQHQISDS